MKIADAQAVVEAVGGSGARIHREWRLLNLRDPTDRDVMVRSLLDHAAKVAGWRGLTPEQVPGVVARHIYYVMRGDIAQAAVNAIHAAGVDDDGPCVDSGNVLWHARRGLGAHLAEVKALLRAQSSMVGPAWWRDVQRAPLPEVQALLNA
jgi:hypothetical protein